MNRTVKSRPKVINMPKAEMTKQEVDLIKSVDDLVEAMRELHQVEKMTGKTGLTARVYLAVTGVMMAAIRVTDV